MIRRQAISGRPEVGGPRPNLSRNPLGSQEATGLRAGFVFGERLEPANCGMGPMKVL